MPFSCLARRSKKLLVTLEPRDYPLPILSWPRDMNHHLRRLLFLRNCLGFLRDIREPERSVPGCASSISAGTCGSGTVRWSVGCGVACASHGSECVTNECLRVSPRVHTVQDAPLHHLQCSSVAVHRHLGARGISCTELHRAPRCRRTSLHLPASAPTVQEGCTESWHRRCSVHKCCMLQCFSSLIFSCTSTVDWL